MTDEARPIGAGDFIICVKSREGADLRRKYPGVTLLSTNYYGYGHGPALYGRVFITQRAEQRVDMEALRGNVKPYAATTGADPTIHRLADHES